MIAGVGLWFPLFISRHEMSSIFGVVGSSCSMKHDASVREQTLESPRLINFRQTGTQQSSAAVLRKKEED